MATTSVGNSLTSPRPEKKPWSIVTRITLFVALVGVLSLLTQVLVLLFWIRPLSDELINGLAAQVQSVRTSLQHSAADQRIALASKLSTPNFVVRMGTLPPLNADNAELRVEDSPLGFAERFQRVVGEDVKIRASRTSPANPVLAFEFMIDGQKWNITFRATPPIFALTNSLLLWISVLAAIIFAALVFGVRMIARPISKLVEQISGQHGAIRPITAGPHATAEMLSIVRAFNSLVLSIEQSNATKQQLLAGVSHDLRTPLSRLRLRIETQCEESLAQSMEADLIALERITNQFLAYVKGDLSSETGPAAALATLCQAIVAQYAAEGRDVRLQYSGNAAFAVPELAVRRMLTNLIDNALAHGKAPVGVEVDAQTDAVTITVCDQGIGMTEAQFASALQPFVRLNPARNTLGHCGLGLAIVSQIANQLRAKVSVRPRSGNTPFGVSVSWSTRTRS
jgi:two-component system, OmpR family, osmolarity sensor histidine kinase EnvZ